MFCTLSVLCVGFKFYQDYIMVSFLFFRLTFSAAIAPVDGSEVSRYVELCTRVLLNIRFVFASGPNSGPNSYSVFGRIVAVGQNTNSGH